MNRRTWRSVGAVVAGLLLITLLSVVTDTVLETTGIFPSLKEQREHGLTTPWMLLLALGYRLVYTAAGGYLTAVLAPRRPVRHAVALGVVGMVLGAAGAVVTGGWDLVPVWFSVAAVVTTPPLAWFGGWLRSRRLHGRAGNE
ncbi:hypothetical protein [Micromonospora sp. CPCC 206061]|uniref:hypothetical protein n=1 Tax=Micromonospora sp. CPCC 206061 TaxID=3122410 RepID=UPI002FF3AE02